MELPTSNTTVLDSHISVNPKHQVIPCSYGVIHFRRLFNNEMQIKILDICHALMSHIANKDLINNRNEKTAFPVLFYNWPGKPNSLDVPSPTSLLNMAQEVKLKAVLSF